MTTDVIMTKSKKFTIAAFDQRSSLLKMLSLDGKTQEGQERMQRLKSVFMETFSPISSGVLVDPDFGLPSLEKRDQQSGLLMSLEAFDYAQENPENTPQLKETWGVKEIAEHNACVKLFFYYNPESVQAERKRKLVESLYIQSKEYTAPFILEPILHPIVGKEQEFSSNYFELQKRMVSDFTHSCDVLKLEFPVAASLEIDEVEHAKRCEEITSLSSVPWILLSRGVSYERYLQTLRIAMKHGAKGVAVGRAVWKDIANLTTEQEQFEYIKTVGKERMLSIIDVVESNG